MARLIKAQQVVLSKALCEAVIKQLTTKHKAILGKYEIKLQSPDSWQNRSSFYILNFASKSNTPVRKAMCKEEFKVGNYKVTMDTSGNLNTKFTKAAQKRIDKANNYLNPVYKDVTRFQDKMDKEFLLRTSFDDMSDIQSFIKIFTKTFN